MEHNIAFCVITYNHPDTVKGVLEQTVELYDRYGIDIYYFDTSETDDTKHIVEEYCARGAANLYYLDMDPEISGSEKPIYAFSGKLLNKHYEYLCLIKDRSFFQEITIQKLQEESRAGYDAILMPVCHWPLDVFPQPETEVYDDPVKFFRDYGTMTTNWETLLMKFDSLLRDVDWEEFYDKYYEDRSCGFEQPLALFSGLAKSENPRIKVLRENEVYREYLPNESAATATATAQVFRIWAKLWPKAVDMLPECYDAYKAYVKKKETMQPGLFGSPHQLVLLAKEKVLTKEKAEQLKSVWADLSDIPYECLEYILEDKQKLLVDRLLEEWFTLMREQKFPQAYHMFCTNQWLKQGYGSYAYNTLEKCFEIYKLELEHGIEEGIFRNVYTVEDAVVKYQTMKYMLRRLEYNVACDIMDKVVPYFVNQKMTVECLSYMIQVECADEEKILNCWALLCKMYQGE